MDDAAEVAAFDGEVVFAEDKKDALCRLRELHPSGHPGTARVFRTDNWNRIEFNVLRVPRLLRGVEPSGPAEMAAMIEASPTRSIVVRNCSCGGLLDETDATPKQTYRAVQAWKGGILSERVAGGHLLTVDPERCRKLLRRRLPEAAAAREQQRRQDEARRRQDEEDSIRYSARHDAIEACGAARDAVDLHLSRVVARKAGAEMTFYLASARSLYVLAKALGAARKAVALSDVKRLLRLARNPHARDLDDMAQVAEGLAVCGCAKLRDALNAPPEKPKPRKTKERT